MKSRLLWMIVGAALICVEGSARQHILDFAADPSIAVDLNGRVVVKLYCKDGAMWNPCPKVQLGEMRGRLSNGETFTFVAEFENAH